MITLDAEVVNVALPSIRDEVSGGITGLQWVVDGYTLSFAAVLLSAGALADRAGARRAFGTGLWVFVAASTAYGLAPDLGALVAARFVQGAAAAMMMPWSMALIGQAYPDPARRARAAAVWAIGASVAATSGPGRRPDCRDPGQRFAEALPPPPATYQRTCSVTFALPSPILLAPGSATNRFAGRGRSVSAPPTIWVTSPPFASCCHDR
jgi:MFS family permease